MSDATLGAASAGDPYLPGSGNGGYHVRRYDLDLEYGMSSNRLAGRATVALTTTASLSGLSLDLGALRVAKVAVAGQRGTKYAHRGRKLHVWLGGTVPAGTPVSVVVQYSGNPRPLRGPWGEVGWEELTEGVIVAGQPDGAPSWFPCNDHPSDKAAYRIRLTTDSPYTVVCNGTLVERTARGSKTTWVYDQPEPMASYLATVQIGRYVLHDTSMSTVRQRAAVPQRLLRTFDGDFAHQGRMMTLFQRVFGPYPFARYTVVVTDDDLEIPLEAQSLSIFGANHVDGRRSAERLVAHELAHQWFGNSLTLARWQDIWLHEGFACYAEWLWSQEAGSDSTDALARKHHDRLRGMKQDLVLGDPGPKLMFDDRVYKRGALTLHALRQVLGDEAFFKLLRTWTARHRHGSVTTADFMACAQEFTAQPLEGFFERWLRRPALPAQHEVRGPGGRSRR
jgi:aminopeptidase